MFSRLCKNAIYPLNTTRGNRDAASSEGGGASLATSSSGKRIPETRELGHFLLFHCHIYTYMIWFNAASDQNKDYHALWAYREGVRICTIEHVHRMRLVD